MTRKPIRKTLPDSLCNLLRQVREIIFEEGLEKFSHRLQRNIRVPNEGFTINRNAVSEIEAKKHNLQYEHLETYAHAVGVPMGVLTLVSRYQYTDLDEAQLVVDSLSAVIRDAKSDGRNKLTIEDLRRLGRMINVKSNGNEHDVKLEDVQRETAVSRLERQKRRLGPNVDDLIKDTALWQGELIPPAKR